MLCGHRLIGRPLEILLEAFLVSTGVVALAARYADVVQVVLGTTFGMMLANFPAVFLGDKIAQ